VHNQIKAQYEGFRRSEASREEMPFNCSELACDESADLVHCALVPRQVHHIRQSDIGHGVPRITRINIPVRLASGSLAREISGALQFSVVPHRERVSQQVHSYVSCFVEWKSRRIATVVPIGDATHANVQPCITRKSPNRWDSLLVGVSQVKDTAPSADHTVHNQIKAQLIGLRRTEVSREEMPFNCSEFACHQNRALSQNAGLVTLLHEGIAGCSQIAPLFSTFAPEGQELALCDRRASLHTICQSVGGLAQKETALAGANLVAIAVHEIISLRFSTNTGPFLESRLSGILTVENAPVLLAVMREAEKTTRHVAGTQLPAAEKSGGPSFPQLGVRRVRGLGALEREQKTRGA